MLFSYVSIMFLNTISLSKKHGIKIISIISILFFWSFVSGDISSNDIFNYLWSYNGALSNSGGIDFGYRALEKIGNLLGFEYRTFRMILSAVSILLITKIIKKYSLNINFVFLIYFAYSIFMDTVQVRNFFAFSVIIFSIQFLVEDVKWRNIKFILGVIIASSIHVSNLVYLILLIIPRQNRKLIYFLLLLTFLLIILFFLNAYFPFFVTLLDGLSIDNSRIIYYFSSVTSYGYLIPISLHLINTLIMRQTKKIVFENIHYIEEKVNKDKISRFINVVYWINIVTISFFPLYMLNLEFMRLSRNLILVNLIAYSIAFTTLHYKKNYQLIYLTVVIISILLWFYYEAIINNHLYDIFINLVNNNYFIN